MSETDISKLNLYALKIKNDQPVEKKLLSFELENRPLPENCKSINDWIIEGSNDESIHSIINYIVSRGMDVSWYPWHWCPENGYRDRVILPFYHNNNIVGWTGRKIIDGKPKYLTDTQPGYVFNIDTQLYDRKYVIVVEGQFDAIAVDGVAIMHNEPNDTQIARINSLGKEVIVVPDNDKAGAKMLQKAIENNWSVSLPNWGNDIKDVADAVKKYGRLYTLFTILHYRETNTVKIQLLKKKLENIKDDKT
jgi:5S rRNA maturation endonuclease (ribonuclease M5)